MRLNHKDQRTLGAAPAPWWREALAAGVLTVATGLAICGGPAHASSLTGKSDIFLQQQAARGRAHGWATVIIRMDGALDARREAALREVGADVYRRLPIIQSAAVRVPVRNLEKLAALPFVHRLAADIAVQKCD